MEIGIGILLGALFGILYFFMRSLRVIRHRRCAYCNCRLLKSDLIKLEDTTNKSSPWTGFLYKTKSGSRDRRRSNNIYIGSYNAIYRCPICSATTLFGYNYGDPPKMKADWNFISRKLKVKGNGTSRKGKDWKK